MYLKRVKAKFFLVGDPVFHFPSFLALFFVGKVPWINLDIIEYKQLIKAMLFNI